MGAWLIQVRAVNKAEVSGLSVWQHLEVAPRVSLRESRSQRSSWLEVMDISFEPIRMPGFKDEEVTTSWYLGKFGLILDGKASLSHALLLSMIPPRYPSYGHCQALLGSCDRWNCIQFTSNHHVWTLIPSLPPSLLFIKEGALEIKIWSNDP